MRGRLSKSQKISIFIYILILVTVQMPWLKIEGERYNIWQGYFCIKDSLVLAEFIWFIVYQVLCVIYIVSILCKKNWYFNIFAEIASIVFVPLNELGWGMWTEDWIGSAFIAVFIVLGGAEFFISRMMDTWEEALKTARQSEQKEKEQKQEERRRLHFPGKYSKLFYRIAWKNFLYHKKDYILFVICGILMCGLSFAGLGLYEAMGDIHTQEKIFISEGLGKILLNAMIPLEVCSVFLLVFVLIFYLKKRIQSYSMFITLGIRKKTLFIIMGLEMAVSIACSLILGLFVGGGIILVFKRFVRVLLGAEFVLAPVTWKIYAEALGVVLLIYLVSFMATRDIFMDFNIISASSRKSRNEKMPKKFLKQLAALGGAAVIWSLLRYTQISCFEKITLLGLMFIGLFFVLRYGGAEYLFRLKRSKKYLSRMIGLNHVYHKSGTCAWYMLVLTGLHIFIMFYFLFQAASVRVAETPEELYPYDFMCIADDGDNAFFERLEKEYGVELISYPMVRIASADNTEKTEGVREGTPPQGQHIGISESVYHELKSVVTPGYKKHSLGLDDEGKTVYIVHQQDKSVRAQPTEWLYTKTRPRLHIGPVCIAYSPFWPRADEQYLPREIAGEEIGSLTGCFRQGRLENLIVFSDTYFEQAKELWKKTDMYTGDIMEEEGIVGQNIRQGPTRLVLIRAADDDIEQLKQEMAELEERHTEDLAYDIDVQCWYSKKDAIYNLKTERIMKQFVNIFVIIVMIMATVFVLYVKVLSELEEKKRRAEFLTCMGMRRKERMMLLRRELYLFYLIPGSIAAVLSVAFTFATFYARMYTVTDVKCYLRTAVPVWLAYGVFQWIVIWIFGRISIHNVEGKNE